MKSEIQVSPSQFLTPFPEPILSATSAIRGDAAYAVWHQVPTDSEHEAVFIIRISDPADGDPRRFIGEGADPDCLITTSNILVSWIKRDFSSDSWSVYISVLDYELNSVSTVTVATNVKNLFSRPYLAKYEGEPILLYVSECIEKQLKLNTYFLNSGRTMSEVFPTDSVEDVSSKYSDTHVIVVIEELDHMKVLKLEREGWNLLTSLPIECVYPHRFDFSLLEETAMFVVSFQKDRLATVALNLSSGNFPEKWTISDYGKFASIASLGSGWIIGWVGSPALSVSEQGKGVRGDMGQYVREIIKIQLELAAEEEKTGITRQRNEIENLFDLTVVGPWAPLWLGLLNLDGKCVKTYGPLGTTGYENWGLQLTTDQNRGIFLWRSFERCEGSIQDCFLNARKISNKD